DHLRAKLAVRNPGQYARLRRVRSPEPHPLFRIVPGPVRDWERR
ncbi:MAG TPA: DNA lyase, partial [Syntrophaceae bacterium]|nr:DNA lyase [Syntrophaceae bacterium]